MSFTGNLKSLCERPRPTHCLASRSKIDWASQHCVVSSTRACRHCWKGLDQSPSFTSESHARCKLSACNGLQRSLSAQASQRPDNPRLPVAKSSWSVKKVRFWSSNSSLRIKQFTISYSVWIDILQSPTDSLWFFVFYLFCSSWE